MFLPHAYLNSHEINAIIEQLYVGSYPHPPSKYVLNIPRNRQCMVRFTYLNYLVHLYKGCMKYNTQVQEPHMQHEGEAWGVTHEYIQHLCKL